MNRREEGEAFVEKLNSLLVRSPDGKAELDVSRLGELVRENPEFALAAAKAYAATATQVRGHGQWALALAAAYQLEFDDDSLYRSVERDLKAAGLGDIQLKFKDMPPAPSQKRAPEVVMLTVDARSLQQAEIYSLTRLLSVGAEQSPELRPSTLRGRVVLGLPLDNDPRPVWQIPEARTFIAKLFEAVPYLPYYLHPHAKLGMALMLFGCLASEDAFDSEGQLNLGHPTVVELVLRSLAAVVEAADRLQESAEAALTQALSIFPDNYVEWLLSQYKIRA